MNSPGTGSTLVRSVRTFADDVRRAQSGGVPSPVHPSAPAPKPPVMPSAPPPSPTHPAFISSKSPPPISPAPVSEPHASQTSPPKPPPETPQLADVQGVFIDGKAERETYEGTIIKDARSKRGRLRKALGNSLNAWVEEQKGTISHLTDTKEQKPKVPPLATRIHVVQAARQKSALAPKDDRRDVVEKLRTFARDAERVTGKKYTLVHKEGSSAPQWTYVEGGKTPQAEVAVKQARPTIRPSQAPVIHSNTPQAPAKTLAKDIAPLAAQGLPEQVFQPKPTVESPKPTVRMDRLPYGAPDVAPTVERQLEPEPEPAPAPPKPAPPPEAPAPDKAREDAIKRLLAVRKERKKPAPPSRDIPFTPPTFDTQKTTNVRTYRNDAIRDVEEHKKSIPQIAAAEHIRSVRRSPQAPAPVTNRATATRPFVIAGMAMVAMIALGGFGIFWYAQQSEVEETTAVRVPTFIGIDAQTPVPFSTNRATLLDTLTASAKSARAGITQIYPAYPEDDGEKGGKAVSAGDFMYVLDPRAPGSFTRNLEDGMMFGVYNATDPFFVFKTKQFDTAFAGMIDWEPNISADLTPLFGETVNRSYDATARTADQTTAARFVDERKGNVDVRVLYDETGAERIVYAFADKNTIVITSSSAALAALLERLQ